MFDSMHRIALVPASICMLYELLWYGRRSVFLDFSLTQAAFLECRKFNSCIERCAKDLRGERECWPSDLHEGASPFRTFEMISSLYRGNLFKCGLS